MNLTERFFLSTSNIKCQYRGFDSNGQHLRLPAFNNIQVRARTEEVMLIRRELLECQRMLQSSEALFCIFISCILCVYLMHKKVHCLLIIVILSSGRCGCVNNLERGFAEDLSDLAEQTSGEEKDFKLKIQLWVE